MWCFQSQIIDRHLPERNCALFAAELTSRVVAICRSKVSVDCAPGSLAFSAAGSVVVEEVPSHLVDQSDFECILCTG